MKRFCVDGEVNRALRYGTKPNLVAAKTSGVEVYVFDVSKKTSLDECSHDLTLKGHEKEGYLLSGSYDSKICVWDVSSMPQSRVLDSLSVNKVISIVVFLCSTHLGCLI